MHDDNDQASREASSLDDSFHYYLRKLQRHPAVLALRRQVRSARTLIPNAWRHATQGSRQLPSAIIVGTAKAGTTQLFAYMIRHPRCFGPTQKEIHFFSYWHERGLPWYRAQFPLRRTVERVRGICLEASPSYFSTPEALWRMKEALPDAALIAILRDPVARAFSHYQHQRTRRREERSFAEIVAETVRRERVAGGVERTAAESATEIKYVAGGYYARHLQVLFDVYPRERVLVLDSDDLFEDTNRVCQHVFGFLGLERFEIAAEKIYNRGFYREMIDPTSRDLLREHYRPHDHRLVELMGRRFRWMDAADNRSASDARAA